MKKPDEDETVVTMSIMVEPELKTAMETAAAEQERSVSYVARKALRPIFLGKKRKGKDHGR
jgi:predicted transcriptional regulator